jgi:hypothetical protein
LKPEVQQPQKKQHQQKGWTGETGQPMNEKYAPSDFMQGTSKFLAQVEKSRKIVEQAWAEKIEENRKHSDATMAKHKDDVLNGLKWAIDGIEKSSSMPGPFQRAAQDSAAYM